MEKNDGEGEADVAAENGRERRAKLGRERE